jgi:hypothetical protein
MPGLTRCESKESASNPEQITTVAESADRYTACAYIRGDRRYDGATVTVFDRPHSMASAE